MRLLRYGTAGFWLSSQALAAPSPSTAWTRSSDQMPEVYDTNVSISLPGGIAVEQRALPALMVGVYVERRGSRASGGSHNGDYTAVTATDAGLQAHWTLQHLGLTDGAFVEPFVGYLKADFKSSATGDSATGRGATGGLLGGYGWFWLSGCNLQVSAGLKRNELRLGSTSYRESDGTTASLKTSHEAGYSATAEVAVGLAL